MRTKLRFQEVISLAKTTQLANGEPEQDCLVPGTCHHSTVTDKLCILLKDTFYTRVHKVNVLLNEMSKSESLNWGIVQLWITYLEFFRFWV
jgi:hypothetical protein